MANMQEYLDRALVVLKKFDVLADETEESKLASLLGEVSSR